MIVYLYSLVGIIGAIGYIPQLIQLIKSTGKSKAISLTTWFIWLGTWVISLLYALLELQDMPFVIVTAVNIAGHLGVISLTIWNRFYRFTAQEYVENLVQYIEQEDDDISLKDVAAAIDEELNTPTL